MGWKNSLLDRLKIGWTAGLKEHCWASTAQWVVVKSEKRLPVIDIEMLLFNNIWAIAMSIQSSAKLCTSSRVNPC